MDVDPVPRDKGKNKEVEQGSEMDEDEDDEDDEVLALIRKGKLREARNLIFSKGALEMLENGK